MRAITLAIGFALLPALCAESQPRVRIVPAGPKVEYGVLREELLHCLEKQVSKDNEHQCKLYLCVYAGPEKGLQGRFVLPTSWSQAVFTYPWRMREQCVWLSSNERPFLSRVPDKDLDLYKGDELNCKKYEERYGRNWEYHEWRMPPTDGVYSVFLRRYQLNKAFIPELKFDPIPLWYDFFPIGESKCLYFVRYGGPLEGFNEFPKEPEKQLIEVWEGTGTWEPREPGKGRWKIECKELESFPAEFTEHFHVHVIGTTFYFVLESGKLLMARKPEKGERKLETLWDDPKKPITAIIDDQDSGKVFVFGKNKNAVIGAKDFCFELAEKPDVKEFDPADLKDVKADEPVKTLWQYASLLAERKKEKK